VFYLIDNCFDRHLAWFRGWDDGYSKTGSLMNMFNNLIIKSALQMYLQKYIHRIVELSIDNQRQTFHAVVEFKGEDKPISMDGSYELSIDEQASVVKVKAQAIKISREWLNLIAQEALGRDFQISGENAAKLIKVIKTMGIA